MFSYWKGSPCKRWISDTIAAPLTVCSDKPCVLPAMFYISRCSTGLYCCIGPQTTTTTTAAAITTSSGTTAKATTTTTTTTTTTQKPAAP